MTGFLHELPKEFDYLDASLSSHLDGCKNYVLGFDYKREQLTRYRVVYHITVNDSDSGKITLRALGAGQSMINVTGPKIEYITNEQWAIIKAAASEDEADNLKVKFHEQNAKPERFFFDFVIGMWYQEIALSGMLDNPPGEQPTTVIKRDKFLQQLAEAFGEEDAKTLCFSLGIDYDDLPAQGKKDKLRELIKQLERENRKHDLVELCKQKRPNYNWDGFIVS